MQTFKQSKRTYLRCTLGKFTFQCDFSHYQSYNILQERSRFEIIFCSNSFPLMHILFWHSCRSSHTLACDSQGPTERLGLQGSPAIEGLHTPATETAEKGFLQQQPLTKKVHISDVTESTPRPQSAPMTPANLPDIFMTGKDDGPDIQVPSQTSPLFHTLGFDTDESSGDESEEALDRRVMGVRPVGRCTIMQAYYHTVIDLMTTKRCL